MSSSVLPAGASAFAAADASKSGAARGCGTREGTALWLNSDVAGVLCAGSVWLLMIFCWWGIEFLVIAPWLGGGSLAGALHSAGFSAACALSLACHARAMLTNPGAVPRGARPLTAEDAARHCHKCDAFKPPRAHHCSVCGRCVLKMDHHCPWINNCVGLANMKYCACV